MYVVGPPQEGLPYLNKDNGWLSYIIRYAVLVIGAITLFYIKPIIMTVREKLSEVKSSEKASEEKESETV